MAHRASQGTARRAALEGLSDYQLGRGCLEELAAVTVTELVILCDAQNHLGHRVALAEPLARCSGKAWS